MKVVLRSEVELFNEISAELRVVHDVEAQLKMAVGDDWERVGVKEEQEHFRDGCYRARKGFDLKKESIILKIASFSQNKNII